VWEGIYQLALKSQQMGITASVPEPYKEVFPNHIFSFSGCWATNFTTRVEWDSDAPCSGANLQQEVRPLVKWRIQSEPDRSPSHTTRLKQFPGVRGLLFLV
jgi:hypothetical protein